MSRVEGNDIDKMRDVQLMMMLMESSCYCREKGRKIQSKAVGWLMRLREGGGKKYAVAVAIGEKGSRST